MNGCQTNDIGGEIHKFLVVLINLATWYKIYYMSLDMCLIIILISWLEGLLRVIFLRNGIKIQVGISVIKTMCDAFIY